MAGNKSAWTEERRARQREIIQQTKPWLKSTGPRTKNGKAVSSQNARMSPELARLDEELTRIRLEALQLFSRNRWPKMPSLRLP